MSPLVVLLVLASAAYGSVVPALWAQPAHHPALVLDPHGRPLDTAEVISARALHLQAKALEGHHGLHAPLVSVAAPVWGAHSAVVSPWIGGHGHLLKKRSLGLLHSAPIAHAIAPAAVSHQSRIDVISSPAVVSHAVAAPAVVAHAAPAVYAVAAPAAVSHQSRVDVHSSPAVVAHSVLAAPAWGTHSLWGAHSAHEGLSVHGLSGHDLSGHGLSVHGLSAHGFSGHDIYGHGLAAHGVSAHGLSAHGLSGHGHWLKKRSLGLWGHAIAPHAVSHQSRVDLVSSPIVSHAVQPAVYAAPAAVSHVSRVDVHSSPAVVAHAAIAPLSHSVHAFPAHYSHHGIHSSPLVHAW